jgi:dihydrofolate reductase
MSLGTRFLGKSQISWKFLEFFRLKFSPKKSENFPKKSIFGRKSFEIGRAKMPVSIGRNKVIFSLKSL